MPHKKTKDALKLIARDVGRDPGLRRLIETERLNAHVAQEQYTFPVYYKPGDMTIWDNLCTNHRGSEWDWNERRDMRRTTVREAPAPAGGDDPFGDLLGAMPAIVPVPAD